jgi:hypothetical protein
MPVLAVKTIEPAALSPEGAGSYLSVTKRQIYFLIADGVLIAKRSGARTLVDFNRSKNTMRACRSRRSARRYRTLRNVLAPLRDLAELSRSADEPS